MPSIFDTFQISSTTHYTSMRVHGNSAQVQLDGQPDAPNKFFRVERVAEGTVITANYPAHFSVHLSIPTPLTIEKTDTIFTVSGLKPTKPLFAGASIDVVHIELYVRPGGATLGTARAMDGNRLIAQGNMPAMQILYAVSEKYYEDGRPGDAYWFELNKRLHLGLGVMFEAGFHDFDSERQQLLVLGAKAIFWT